MLNRSLLAKCFLGGIVSLVGLAAHNTANAQATEEGDQVDVPQQAVAVLIPTEGSQVSGVILLEQQGDKVHVQGRVWGLAPGEHGFHIHQYGDLRSPTGEAAGGHYSPEGNPHGAPDAPRHHAGDLGNIQANQEGIANIDATFDFFKVHHVLGRSIVVHAGRDDLESQPSGAAGARAAVGVIGIANPNPPAREPQQ